MDSTKTNANQTNPNGAGGIVSLLLVLLSLAVIVWAGYGIWTSNSLQSQSPGTIAGGGVAAGAFSAGNAGIAQQTTDAADEGAAASVNAEPGNAGGNDTAAAAGQRARGNAAAPGMTAPITGTLSMTETVPMSGTFPMRRNLPISGTMPISGTARGAFAPLGGANSGGNRGANGGGNPAARDAAQPDAAPEMETASSPQAEAATAAPEDAVPTRVAASTASSAASVARLTAVVGAKGVQLWSDGDGALMESIDPGVLLTATGRSEDGAWLYIASDGGSGWIDAASVVAFGTERLPAIAMTVEPQLDSAVVIENPDEEESVDEDASTAATSAPDTDTAATDITSTGTATEAVTFTSAAVATGTITLPDDARLNVRSGPGDDARIIAKAYGGEEYGLLARSEDGAWVQLEMPEIDGGFGWVAAGYVDVDTPFDELPVSDAVSDAPYYQQEVYQQEVYQQEVYQQEADTGGGATVQPVVLETGGVAAPPTGDQPTSTTTGVTGLSGTLVFQESNGGVFHAYDFETGQTWPLVAGLDPAISPDGQTVAFTRDGGENGIYLIDIDGSNERLIFSGRAGLRSPKWSPDGQWIVFSRADEYDECYEMGRACLTLDDLDGRIPIEDLEEFPMSKDYKYQLAAVDPNGENYHDIASLDSARAPDWVAAGITYQSAAGIQITQDEHAAQSELVTFNYLKPFYHDPDWSPDGSSIAFMSKEGSHWEIFTVNPDGSGMTALTRPSTTLAGVLPSNAAPAWSPDGQYIAFVSNRTEAGNAGPWRVWVMNADGSNQQPLDLPFTIDYGFGDDQAVSWGG